MWLVFLLLIFMIGIIFSTLEINLSEIFFQEKKFNFKIIISFKLFGFFKVLFLRLDKNRAKILGEKFNISKYKIKKIDKKVFKLLKDFDIKFKKVDFICKIGILDIGLTNIVIVLFSSVFPIIIKDRVARKDFNFKVFPEYNKLCFKAKGKFIISLKILTLLKLYFKNKKLKMMHNKSKNYDVKESF